MRGSLCTASAPRPTAARGAQTQEVLEANVNAVLLPDHQAKIGHAQRQARLHKLMHSVRLAWPAQAHAQRQARLHKLTTAPGCTMQLHMRNAGVRVRRLCNAAACRALCCMRAAAV